MSKRGYAVFAAVLAVLSLTAAFVGQWVYLVALVPMVLAGIFLTLRYERLKWGITQSLQSEPEEDQNARLVWLEQWADRPEILGNLGRRGPAVPLRVSPEQFAHDSHHLTVLRWTFVGTAALEIFIGYLAVFHPPSESSEWPYIVALLLGFGASLAYLPSQFRRFGERIEVTEHELRVVHGEDRRLSIPWDSIREVRVSSMTGLLTIRATSGTVRIPYVIRGYGRLANLIAARLPAGVEWCAV